MFNLFKKIAISLIAIILVSSQLFLSTNTLQSIASASTEGDISLRIDLKDEIFTKSNRMTFNVWARDANDEKIEDSFVTVTNNGNDVDINWSDSVKTSYTVYFDEGINNLHVLVNYDGQLLERAFTITYEFAEDGEMIGEYIFSLEGFVVGLDYIIEPIKLPIIKGENAAAHLERALAEHGFTTSSTGNTDSGYYLSTIYGGNLLERATPEIPQAIIDASYELGWVEPNPYDYYPEDGLGGFAFNYMSGWMYAVNNDFPNVGFSDYYLMNEDVMRVQFTIAYGSDIGDNYFSSGDPYFEPVTRDALTEMLATINTSSTKEILLNNADVRAAYDYAYETVTTVGISQLALNAAEEQLSNVYEEAKITALIELIDSNDMSAAFYDIEKLTPEELNKITNLSNLDAQAKAVSDAIEALPTVEHITVADEATINEITAKFAALNEHQQKFVRASTVATLTTAQQTVATLIEEAKATTQPIIDLINNLPAKEALTLADKPTLLAAKDAFDALPHAYQSFVTNAQTLEEVLILLDELQTALNNLSITAVINQINTLTTADSVTLEDETSILSAQAAYDALDDTLKADVTNAHFLTILAQVLDELRAAAAKFQAEIQAAINLIAALPGVENIALSDEAQLVEAQDAFDALTADQQELVTNKELLTAITAQITELKLARDNAAAAAKVDAAINTLPSAVALTDAEKIKQTRALFTALTLAQQTLVTKLAQLVEAEAQLTLLNSAVEKPENDKQENSGSSNNRPNTDDDDDREEPVSSNSSSGSSTSTGGASSAPNQAAPVEKPTTLAPEAEATTINSAPSTPIKTVIFNPVANTVDIAVEGNTAAMKVALTPTVLAMIQAQDGDTVVIKNEKNISVEIPKAVFEENFSLDSEIYLEVQAEKQHDETQIKFVLKEKFSDGTEREISLNNTYVKVKFPLTVLTQVGPTASLTPIAQDKLGVILRVVDGEYKAVPHQIKNGEVSIYANANDEYIYSTEVITFEDIEKLANKADIEFLASRYVVNGTSDTTFEPNQSITRAQFGAMIARALNLVPTEETHYADTKGKWYEKDIQALYEAGITNAPGNFNPSATLNREQAAAFMYRVMHYIQKGNTPTATATMYADQANINANYTEAIATLNKLNIMQGKDGNIFDPKGDLTRAQMAKILRKTLEAIEMM